MILTRSETIDFPKINGYQVIKLLGQGQYKVYLVQNIKQQRLEACKIIPVNPAKKDSETGILEQISMLQAFIGKHYIVQYYSHFKNKEKNEYYIFLEYCEHGNLLEFMREKYSDLNFKKLIDVQSNSKQYFKQILIGTRPYRKIFAIHRDLKLQNILVTGDVMKISDFGGSKILLDKMAHTKVGTIYTMAPEVLVSEDRNYDHKCDIWSLGIIYYYLLYRKLPWFKYTASQQLKQIESKILSFPQDTNAVTVSQQSKQFIKGCLTKSVKDRLDWQDLQYCPLFISQPNYDNQKYHMNLNPENNQKQWNYLKHYYINFCRFFKIAQSLDYDYSYLQSLIDSSIDLTGSINTQNTIKNNQNLQSNQQKLFTFYDRIYLEALSYILKRIDYYKTLLDKTFTFMLQKLYDQNTQLLKIPGQLIKHEVNNDNMPSYSDLLLFKQVITYCLVSETLRQLEAICMKNKSEQNNIFNFHEFHSYCNHPKYHKIIQKCQQQYSRIQKLLKVNDLKTQKYRKRFIQQKNITLVEQAKSKYIHNFCRIISNLLRQLNLQRDHFIQILKLLRFLMDQNNKRYKQYKEYQKFSQKQLQDQILIIQSELKYNQWKHKRIKHMQMSNT